MTARNTLIPEKILATLDNHINYGSPEAAREARLTKQHLLSCPTCQAEMARDSGLGSVTTKKINEQRRNT